MESWWVKSMTQDPKNRIEVRFTWRPGFMSAHDESGSFRGLMLKQMLSKIGFLKIE